MSAAHVRMMPSEFNFALPPAWRWERARWLREQGKYARKGKEDPWVVLLQRFQKELEQCTSGWHWEKLVRKYPGLYWAWHWWHDTEKRTRYTMEAYLCASASHQHIAERVGQHPITVGCYSKSFFDVEGKQKHWAYMLNEVIGKNIHLGLSAREYDCLWKLYGLFCGPLLLDHIMQYVREPGPVAARAQLSGAVSDLIHGAMDVKTLYAARTIPVDYNQEIIFATWNKMTEIEKSSDNPQQGQSLIMERVFSMVQGFGFTIAKGDALDATASAHYHSNGVERRAGEMVLTALGERPSNPVPIPMTFPEAQDEQPHQQGS